MLNEKTTPLLMTKNTRQIKALQIFTSKVYIACLVFAIPFSMLQEILVNMPEPSKIEIVPLQSLIMHMFNPKVILFYSIMTVIHLLATIFYISPIKKYLQDSNSFENARKRFDNPTIMIGLNILSGSIAILTTYFLTKNYQENITIPISIVNIAYRFFWQILTGYLIVYALLNANISVEEFFAKDYHRRSKKSLISQSRTSILYMIMVFLIVLSMLKTVLMLNSLSKETTDLIPINSLISHNTNNIFLIIFSVLWIIYLYHSLSENIKSRIYNFLHQCTESGIDSTIFFFQEKNMMGSIVQALNGFIHTIFEKFNKLFSSVLSMIEQRGKLSKQITDFTEVIHNQVVTFSDLTVSKKSIDNNMEQLVQYLDSQRSIFQNIDTHIHDLTDNTELISHSFDTLNQEHIQCLLSTQEATTSLNSFIATSGSIKNQLQEIFMIIEDTSIETNNINEILTTIKNIAEQTKLLSISASIEAAHGGSSSSDFSSVAEEIRVLADMSHDAVNNIAMRVSAIRNFIENSIVLSTEGDEVIDSNIKDSKYITETLNLSLQNTQLLNHNISSFTEKMVENISVLNKGEEASKSIAQFLSLLYDDISTNQPLSSNLYKYLAHYKSLILHNEQSLQKLDTLEHAWQIKEFQMKQIINHSMNEN
ncbi:MAG: methyl-accepting chemotaxis protein, partial [Brevinema sp.]